MTKTASRTGRCFQFLYFRLRSRRKYTDIADHKGGIAMAQFTKAAIMDAFVRLLEQQPLDQITV